MLFSIRAFHGCLRDPQRCTQTDASWQDQGTVHPAPLAGSGRGGTTGHGGGSLPAIQTSGGCSSNLRTSVWHMQTTTVRGFGNLDPGPNEVKPPGFAIECIALV